MTEEQAAALMRFPETEDDVILHEDLARLDGFQKAVDTLKEKLDGAA